MRSSEFAALLASAASLFKPWEILNYFYNPPRDISEDLSESNTFDYLDGAYKRRFLPAVLRVLWRPAAFDADFFDVNPVETRVVNL